MGAFLIFALINITLDEIKRHKDFNEKVTKAKAILTDEYKVDANTMNEYLEEFEKIEKAGDTFNEEEERNELAEIN